MVEYPRALGRSWHHWKNVVQFKGSHVFASLEDRDSYFLRQSSLVWWSVDWILFREPAKNGGLLQLLGKDDFFHSHDSKGFQRIGNSQTSGFLEFEILAKSSKWLRFSSPNFFPKVAPTNYGILVAYFHVDTRLFSATNTSAHTCIVLAISPSSRFISDSAANGEHQNNTLICEKWNWFESYLA